MFAIGIGNVTWGGTGKTAAAIEIGKYLQEKGYRLAVVSRGYKRKSSGLQVVRNPESIQLDVANAGDEPFLIAQKLPGSWMIVSGDRHEALRFIEENAPDVQIILYDDAFQQRKLKKDLDLVMVDASEDVMSLHRIPLGKLREPLSAVKRASAVVLTHFESVHSETARWAAGLTGPRFHANYRLSRAVSAAITGKRMAAFCATGAPGHFWKLLQDRGEIVWSKAFRDHHRYSRKDQATIWKKAADAGAECVVTTAKDAVKLHAVMAEHSIPLIVADAVLEFDPMFWTWLNNQLPPL